MQAAADQRRAAALRRLTRFAGRLDRGARVLHLGPDAECVAAHLMRRGLRPVTLDAALAPRSSPGVATVRARAAWLPFGRGVFDGAIASDGAALAASPAVVLAQLHSALRVGGLVELLASEQRGTPRLSHPPGELRLLLEGAGFGRVRLAASSGGLRVRAESLFTLPDYVAPQLGLLICGLNPSVFSAQSGIPFGRPGNRFWPAARHAGLCRRDRDPWDALACGIGFTDLVKRTTRRASELEAGEYVGGLQRLEAVVRLFEPGALCFVGLEGWRRAVDRKAGAGWIAGGFAGRPAYLMPSTSGLNAHGDLEGFSSHLRRASRAGTRTRILSD